MLAILIAASAAACVPPEPAPKGSHATYYTDTVPPSRYRKLGAVTMETHAARDIPGICNEGPPTCGFVTEACSTGTDVKPVIHLPDPCPFAQKGEAWARLACHELGHALGHWPAYHGD